MAHIHRRERAGVVRYYARYIDPATGKERSKSFRTEQAVERFLEQCETATLAGRREPAVTRMTFATLLMPASPAPGKAVDIQTGYASTITHEPQSPPCGGDTGMHGERADGEPPSAQP